MADILTYVLHYEGAFNKNSLGAVSEAGKLAGEIGGEAAAIVVGGDDLTDELCASLGKYGASKVYIARAPEGLAQPVVDVMAKLIVVIPGCMGSGGSITRAASFPRARRRSAARSRRCPRPR